MLKELIWIIPNTKSVMSTKPLMTASTYFFTATTISSDNRTKVSTKTSTQEEGTQLKQHTSIFFINIFLG